MNRSKRLPIPENVREQAHKIVADFNEKIIRNPDCFYVLRFTGEYLYLDRPSPGSAGPIARLKYQGGMNDWTFAIYKYSSQRYDSDEWFFPGSEHVDGTVAGAMKAGLEAYPLPEHTTSIFRRIFSLLPGGKR